MKIYLKKTYADFYSVILIPLLSKAKKRNLPLPEKTIIVDR
jgi:hypothetical protein